MVHPQEREKWKEERRNRRMEERENSMFPLSEQECTYIAVVLSDDLVERRHQVAFLPERGSIAGNGCLR